VIRAGEAQGVLRATSDLVIGADGSVPSGIGVFRHTVAPGRAADFVTAENQLAEASKKFPGFERVCTFAPGADGESISVLRFRTDNQLKAWLSSDERINALGGLRSSLTHEFSLVSSTTAFGATIRTENGRTAVTPNWKTAMLILLVLYPTVMLLSRFLGPVLDGLGAPPWLGLWSSQVISVVALQWVLMPWAGRRFRRWLDPIDGASRRVSVLGAAVMVGGYAVTLMLFATVQWLQFWDYSPD
jgi:antibiotic biosynthesis monooxygenase (ABM) superfamily enzyme